MLKKILNQTTLWNRWIESEIYDHKPEIRVYDGLYCYHRPISCIWIELLQKAGWGGHDVILMDERCRFTLQYIIHTPNVIHTNVARIKYITKQNTVQGCFEIHNARGAKLLTLQYILLSGVIDGYGARSIANAIDLQFQQRKCAQCYSNAALRKDKDKHDSINSH